jgi:DNA-binding transcriptional LysR family regulator
MAVRGEGIAGDMFERLAAGELDAAFCLLAGEPPEEFAIERLSEDEAVAAFAPDRAPAEGDVGVAELSGQVLVGPSARIGHHLCPRPGVRRCRAAAASGPGERRSVPARALAAQGFGVAILPRSLTTLPGPPLTVRSLRPAVRLPVALVWRRSRQLSPAARMFIEFSRAR